MNFLSFMAAYAALPLIAAAVDVVVNDVQSVGHTTDSFLGFSFDTTALFPNSGRVQLDFTNPVLVNYTRNFPGSYVRFGGSMQDSTVYNLTGEFAEPMPANFQQFYLDSPLWDTVVSFARQTGLKLVFGLNAKVGRQDASGNPTGTWNFTNVASLLQYINTTGQTDVIGALELGNESNVFNCSGTCANLTAGQLVGMYAQLRPAVQSLLPGVPLWGPDPSITGDVKGQCRSAYGPDLFGFLRDFLDMGGNRLVDAVTWHYYPQYEGDNTSGIPQMLGNEYQSRLAVYDGQARAVLQATAPRLPIILGETSSYWGGGLANASNRYASGFWYLNQLGYAARYSYAVHIRQDLAGGNYGLLDLVQDAEGTVIGYTPNPDFWSHALWRMLVGAVSLEAAVGPHGPDVDGVRAWALCANTGPAGLGPAAAGDVVLVISNFNTSPVNITIDFILSKGGSGLTTFVLASPQGGMAGLTSKDVLLNGQLLITNADLSLPNLQAMGMAQPVGQPLSWPALSYGFVWVKGAGVEACSA